jgi:hypothetical protein
MPQTQFKHLLIALLGAMVLTLFLPPTMTVILGALGLGAYLAAPDAVKRLDWSYSGHSALFNGASFLFGSGASEIVSPHLGLTGFGTLLVFLPILLVLLWGVWPKIARTYL